MCRKPPTKRSAFTFEFRRLNGLLAFLSPASRTAFPKRRNDRNENLVALLRRRRLVTEILPKLAAQVSAGLDRLPADALCLSMVWGDTGYRCSMILIIKFFEYSSGGISSFDRPPRPYRFKGLEPGWLGIL